MIAVTVEGERPESRARSARDSASRSRMSSRMAIRFASRRPVFRSMRTPPPAVDARGVRAGRGFSEGDITPAS